MFVSLVWGWLNWCYRRTRLSVVTASPCSLLSGSFSSFSLLREVSLISSDMIDHFGYYWFLQIWSWGLLSSRTLTNSRLRHVYLFLLQLCSNRTGSYCVWRRTKPPSALFQMITKTHSSDKWTSFHIYQIGFSWCLLIASTYIWYLLEVLPCVK